MRCYEATWPSPRLWKPHRLTVCRVWAPPPLSYHITLVLQCNGSRLQVALQVPGPSQLLHPGSQGPGCSWLPKGWSTRAAVSLSHCPSQQAADVFQREGVLQHEEAAVDRADRPAGLSPPRSNNGSGTNNSTGHKVQIP